MNLGKKNTMRNILILAMLVTLGQSCQNASDNKVKEEGFTIRGKIAGVHAGRVKLIRSNEDTRTSKTIDSIPFANDSFVLKGKVDHPEMMMIMIDSGSWSMNLFIENGNIKVEGDTSGSEHYDWTHDDGSKGAFLKNYIVTGSKSQDEWMKYQNDPGQKQYDSTFIRLSHDIMTAKDKDIEYQFRDQYDSLRLLLNKWKLNWIRNFATTHPSSTAGVYMFYKLNFFYSNMPVPTMDSALKLFSGEATSTSYFKSLDTTLNKRKALLPGNIAPDFTLLKRDSSRFTLSSSRGKYVMIDFWASWCHPCRQAIPHWKTVYAKYHSKGFDMVSVSDDSSWKDWVKAMDKEQMPWLQVCDEFPIQYMPAKVGTLYMTTYIPFYILLDKEGKIILYTSSEKEIDAKLVQLFG